MVDTRLGSVRLWLCALALGLPLAAHAQAYTKTETIEYHDDLSLWVLGQVKRTTTNGVETSRTEYAWKAKPTKTYAFGKLHQTIGYNIADGTVSSVTDGDGSQTSFANWKRNIPQAIAYADGTALSAAVNDAGWITSVTDENNYKTCYGYDAMGRLNSTIYPSESALRVCDQSAWDSTGVEFRPMLATEWRPPGVVAGQWRQYAHRGNYQQIVYYDALWRPVLTHQYDATDMAGTLQSISTTYDDKGRVAFQSYPSNDLIPPAVGTWTFYDALDRVTQVKQDSELSLLTTTTEYLSGFVVRVTNPNGQQITSSYQAFDQPTYDFPVQILSAGEATTEIARDVFGKPLEITRR